MEQHRRTHSPPARLLTNPVRQSACQLPMRFRDFTTVALHIDQPKGRRRFLDLRESTAKIRLRFVLIFRLDGLRHVPPVRRGLG
jgi:hypothetical protein